MPATFPRVSNTTAWMTIAVYDRMPTVPSKQAAAVYRRQEINFAGQLVTTFRLEFSLFSNDCPKTVENFVKLCNESATPLTQPMYEGEPVPLSYRGTFLHKIIPNFIVHGGDVTHQLRGGANHLSTFGAQFDDESLRRPFNAAGLLGMANNGPNTNGCQFFITTSANEEKALNARHCCFGTVTSGLEELLRHVAPHGNSNGEALRFAVVVDCGAEVC